MPSSRRPPAVMGPLLIVVLLGVWGARARAAAPRVPEVVLGPDAAERAPRVEARIVEVTVFSDRARVRRRGRIEPLRDAGVVRLPDLPGAVLVDTIRLGASGARVLHVSAQRIERERAGIDQAIKLLDELDAVTDQLAELEDRESIDNWEIGFVSRLAPAAPVPEDKREGRKALAVDVPSWWKALDFFSARAGAARGRLVKLTDERRLLDERRQKLRDDVAALNRGGFSDRAISVLAVLEPAGAAPPELELEYFVPGASWKPAYDLHFSPSRGQLRMETAAVVQQATGEDWNGVALSFSTAIPGQGIDLPELLTWTLGERDDFVPQLRPRAPPPREPPIAMQAPVSPAARATQIDVEVIRERLARAFEGVQAPLQGAAVAARPPPQAMPAPAEPMPSMPAPAPVPSMAGAFNKSSAEAGESDEEAEAPPPRRPARAAMLAESSSPASTRSASARVSRVPLSLFEAPPARRAPVFTDPYLPAVSAGGFDYVYPAPTVASVPSTGKQVRIPLAAQSFRASAFYEATPALAPTAFLRARVRNDGKRPLLRGPTVVFSDGELVGQGEIGTTGPSGEIEFPLGADQDIRLVRQVVPATKTTGLIMKSEETTYDVQIQVGNYKKQPVTIEIIDQVPHSRRDEVDVKLLGTDPAPAAPPDIDGVMRFRVDLPPGATRTLRLRYQIVRPKGWRLYQR